MTHTFSIAARLPGFDFLLGQKIFRFSTDSRRKLGFTQPPTAAERIRSIEKIHSPHLVFEPVAFRLVV
jgi:hypothetical protein